MCENNIITNSTKYSKLLESDFIFLSPYKSLVARGITRIFSQPTEDAHNINSIFHKNIDKFFSHAKKNGVKKPIIVGVIPFDKSQNCYLYIPENYYWIDRKEIKPPSFTTEYLGNYFTNPDHDEFCLMVNDALLTLRKSDLIKVVLSRLLYIEPKEQLNSLQLWLKLNQQNPSSYNFHVPLENKTLIGASPELLLRKKGNIINTTPLAGSISRGENNYTDERAQKNLLNSSKDITEHNIVIEAIRQCLNERCKTLNIPKASLYSTPTLWHLATHISGIIDNPYDNALSLACLLHPTPALCGTPSSQAKELINKLEPFNRGWFGGIVGWCDTEGNGEWVVTIRSGIITPNRIELFAGAGIVENSKPESEWLETGVKLKTMLHALGFNIE